MNEEQRRPNVTLDSMVALVEQAVRTIDRLQKENDALKARLGACESEASAAVAQFNAQSSRLQEVELRMSTLIQDAEWTRWFQRKYSDSTFYNHIERVFAEEHGLPMPPERAGVMVA
jgi:hypothetical protein